MQIAGNLSSPRADRCGAWALAARVGARAHRCGGVHGGGREQVANGTFFDPGGGDVALVLLAAGPAAALGLGQIQVKSQPQSRSSPNPDHLQRPSELQGLQVQLASPETFRRVGLEPPQGAASSLHFEPALDAAGHPVIRVTSAVPIQPPLLTFLLEVDWGQGRLVREYSALIDAPRTVAAPIQPPIQAPAVAPSNMIDRPPAPAVAATPPVKSTPPPPPNPPALPTPAAPAPKPLAAAQVPPTPGNAPVDASTPADHYGPVKAGQTLGQIAANLEGTQGYSVAQTMLALLVVNPEAFIGGNINRLKRGALSCACRRRTNWQGSTSARPPRWCMSRSRNGAKRAAPCRSLPPLRPLRRRPRLRVPPATRLRRPHRHAPAAHVWKSFRRRRGAANRPAHDPASKPVARVTCCDSNCRRPRRRSLPATPRSTNSRRASPTSKSCSNSNSS